MISWPRPSLGHRLLTKLGMTSGQEGLRKFGVVSEPGRLGRLSLMVGEVLIAVGAASLVVAALASTAPAAGLGIIYLLAVLAVAVRRGQLPALATAVLSVLSLNYFFIAPTHRLTVSHSQDFAELCVLLIAAVVVGRLAAASRQRSAEAEFRARVASAREREATLLAQVASAILAGESVRSQLSGIGRRVAAATGASHARITLGPVPSPAPDERMLSLPTRAQRAWLYVARDAQLGPDELTRIVEPLARLLDVAVERERVTEQAAESEAARRAEIARTAILHAISHDLRSPLTAITTAASALRASGITEAEREGLVDVIESDSMRLARLVSDLLDLSRIQAGAVAPQADWCDLHDIVASAVAQAGAERPVNFELPVRLPLVRADAAQLERVFSNLIDNAVKFSPGGTPIEISGGVGSRWVTVRVSDHGRGVPKPDRPHVFEPFFRGRGEHNGGSGLGLAISRGFVEANGGRIALSDLGGEGASFAVSFPVMAQPVGVE